LNFYADSSFLVSLYITDSHSVACRRQVLSSPGLWFTPLHSAEWAHAISQHQFRRKMDSDEARESHAHLEGDKRRGIWIDTAIPERAFEVCVDLARRHGPSLGTRTLDSLHVACALELKAERFWTFDDRQAKLARAEGLKTS
jgi:predicted nucleic acid-binding protein